MTIPTNGNEKNESLTQGFPRRFVGFNCEYGFKALTDWLEKQGAPQEIIDLTEGLACCNMCLEAPGENIDENHTEVIGGSLAGIARGLHFVGVDLHTPESVMKA